MSQVDFIIAQVLGVAATIILSLSYVVKSKKTFLLLGILGDIVYGASFIFVGSAGAGIIVMLSCIQNIFFYLYGKKGKILPYYISGIFIVLFIVAGVLDFSSAWDLIPMLSYIMYTIALYFNNMKQIRIMYLIPNLFLTLYDIIVMAYASALEDGIEGTFLIIVIILDFVESRKKKKNKKRKKKRKKNKKSKPKINSATIDSNINNVDKTKDDNKIIIKKDVINKNMSKTNINNLLDLENEENLNNENLNDETNVNEISNNDLEESSVMKAIKEFEKSKQKPTIEKVEDLKNEKVSSSKKSKTKKK